jgi:hypothetical protein
MFSGAGNGVLGFGYLLQSGAAKIKLNGLSIGGSLQ